MRIVHYILVVGVMLGVVGFIVAAGFDERQIGIYIFLAGFFLGAASAVFVAITSARNEFGKLGSAIRIVAGGFGVVVLGQLFGFLLDRHDVIENILFFVGFSVMIIGIAVAALRMMKF